MPSGFCLIADSRPIPPSQHSVNSFLKNKARKRAAFVRSACVHEPIFLGRARLRVAPDDINHWLKASLTSASGVTGAGPHSAKDADEIVRAPPMGCIANAIYISTGVHVNKLPPSQEIVLHAL